LSRIIRARYENGVLRPLDKIELGEGEEVRVIIVQKEFPELLREIEIEALEDIDKLLREGRNRWKRWY